MIVVNVKPQSSLVWFEIMSLSYKTVLYTCIFGATTNENEAKQEKKHPLMRLLCALSHSSILVGINITSGLLKDHCRRRMRWNILVSPLEMLLEDIHS